MTEDILSTLTDFVSIAEREGADEAEIFALSRKEKSVVIESNSLKTAVSSYQQGVGIRVLINKSIGFAAVNSIDKDRVLEGIRNSLSIARVTPPENHHILPTAMKPKSINGLHDKNVDSINMEDVLEITKEMLETIQETDPRLSVDSAGVVARSEVRSIASSTGIAFHENKSSMTWGIFGWAVDDDDIGTFHLESDSVVSLKDLNHIEGAANFSDKAINSLNASKTEAFKGCAIFSPEALRDIFYILVIAAMGITIQGGNSYLQDKLGEEVAHKDFTMIDDGTLPNRVSSNSFDREGVATTKLSIIDSGVFKGIMYNAFTGSKAGLESTGHGSGTYRTAPGTSPTNLEVLAGANSIEDMISDISHGIYIERISTMPDPTSGDFSGVIKGGKLIKNGEIKQTLKEVTVTGNIFQSIKDISMISKEQKHLRTPGDTPFVYLDGSWCLPYIRIENLDFSV